LLSLLDVAYPSLLVPGRVGLDRVGGHARGPAKPCESRVHDDDGACDLPRARGSYIPCSGGGIRHSLRDILRLGVWCAITPISSLSVVVLWPGITSPDPLRYLAHGDLCDPVRGLYGDLAPLLSMELLSRPATTGLWRRNGGFGQCGQLCPI
jgi:hypothetical protein